MSLSDSIRRLQSYGEGSLEWYAVIEGAHPQFDTLRLLYEFDDRPRWFYVFESSHFEKIQKAGPILFRLEKPEGWLHYWQKKFPGLSGSMLISMAPMIEVRRHLEKLASVRLANQREAIFRFYDSWIMSGLYPLLNNVERNKLHGPVHQWLWCTRGALLFSDETKVVPEKVCPADEPTWLTLDEAKVSGIQQSIVSKRNWELGSNE